MAYFVIKWLITSTLCNINITIYVFMIDNEQYYSNITEKNNFTNY